MNKRMYKVGDLRRSLQESASEFKPKYGKGVEGENKKINDKAYRDMNKETGDYNKGIEGPKVKNPGHAQIADANRGLTDLQYDNEPGKPFYDKVNSQLKGYIDDKAEKAHKNDAFGNATFDDAIAKEAQKHAAEAKAETDAESEIGLNSRMKKKEDTHRHNSTLGENRVKRLNFKGTQFLSEKHILAHVPDHYKTEGNRFVMKDATGEEFLVEWANKEKPLITRQINKKRVAEDMDRMKYLFDYGYKDTKTTPTVRLNEEKNMTDMLGRVRKLMK